MRPRCRKDFLNTAGRMLRPMKCLTPVALALVAAPVAAEAGESAAARTAHACQYSRAQLSPDAQWAWLYTSDTPRSPDSPPDRNLVAQRSVANAVIVRQNPAVLDMGCWRNHGPDGACVRDVPLKPAIAPSTPVWSADGRTLLTTEMVYDPDASAQYRFTAVDVASGAISRSARALRSPDLKIAPYYAPPLLESGLTVDQLADQFESCAGGPDDPADPSRACFSVRILDRAGNANRNAGPASLRQAGEGIAPVRIAATGAPSGAGDSVAAALLANDAEMLGYLAQGDLPELEAVNALCRPPAASPMSGVARVPGWLLVRPGADRASACYDQNGVILNGAEDAAGRAVGRLVNAWLESNTDFRLEELSLSADGNQALVAVSDPSGGGLERGLYAANVETGSVSPLLAGCDQPRPVEQDIDQTVLQIGNLGPVAGRLVTQDRARAAGKQNLVVVLGAAAPGANITTGLNGTTYARAGRSQDVLELDYRGAGGYGVRRRLEDVRPGDFKALCEAVRDYAREQGRYDLSRVVLAMPSRLADLATQAADTASCRPGLITVYGAASRPEAAGQETGLRRPGFRLIADRPGDASPQIMGPAAGRLHVHWLFTLSDAYADAGAIRATVDALRQRNVFVTGAVRSSEPGFADTLSRSFFGPYVDPRGDARVLDAFSATSPERSVRP